jgi:hypothetical protein
LFAHHQYAWYWWDPPKCCFRSPTTLNQNKFGSLGKDFKLERSKSPQKGIRKARQLKLARCTRIIRLVWRKIDWWQEATLSKCDRCCPRKTRSIDFCCR